METAKVDTYDYQTSEVFNIIISDTIYTFTGMTYLEGISHAIDNHIAGDGNFTDYITVNVGGEIVESLYAPALLCGLGYISKEKLLSFLIDLTFEEEDTDGET